MDHRQKLSPRIDATVPEVLWSDVAGLRDRLVIVPTNVDLAFVSRTSDRDLLPFQIAVERLSR